MRRWDVIAALLNELHAVTPAEQLFVEVGTKEGRLTAHVLEHCRQARVMACDPWEPQPPSADRDAETYADWDFKQIADTFQRLTAPWADRLQFVQEVGDTLALSVLDGSADVVFLDARHDLASVRSDIRTWWPKVRPGGWLAGHDFNHKWPGVQRAVAEHFDLMQVVNAPDSVWMFAKPSR